MIVAPLLAIVFSLRVLATGSLRRACRADQPGAECLACHGEKSMTTTRAGKTVSLYVDGKKFAGVHPWQLRMHGLPRRPGRKRSAARHAAGAGKMWHLPRDRAGATCPLPPRESHCSRRSARAPLCQLSRQPRNLPVKDPRSAVTPLKVPFVCGQCHREGTPVSRNRPIPQDNILENYSESIHGEALLKKGLSVAPNCATCHTPHLILPHTDPASSINRKNIAATCTKCHSQIETVHRKIIRGELWEKEANVLPACVDCHQPHKIRNVFYSQGMADADCMHCHADEKLRRARDGQSMFVNVE